MQLGVLLSSHDWLLAMQKPPDTNNSMSNPPEWLAKATELKLVTLERLTATPESERDTVYSAGGWSAAGVVEHLVLLEEIVPGLWKERLAAVPSAKAGAKSALLSKIVSFSITKTRIRVPTVKELEPLGAISVEELDRRWFAAREGLIAALPENAKDAWVLHPAFGPLSSNQMGRLIASHLEHHLRHWPGGS